MLRLFFIVSNSRPVFLRNSCEKNKIRIPVSWRLITILIVDNAERKEADDMSAKIRARLCETMDLLRSSFDRNVFGRVQHGISIESHYDHGGWRRAYALNSNIDRG